MTAKDTVCAAFKNAVFKRRLSKTSGLMIHSDRGVQYASNEFRILIEDYNCIQSMSRKGNCWDNAVAESFLKQSKSKHLININFKIQFY